MAERKNQRGQRAMMTLKRFGESYCAVIEHLYTVSGCVRFAISKPDFSAALYRASEARFADVAVQSAEVEQFLAKLHVADLALALACGAGNEDAWQVFHDILMSGRWNRVQNLRFERVTRP